MTEKEFMLMSGYSSLILEMRSVPIPDLVPSPGAESELAGNPDRSKKKSRKEGANVVGQINWSSFHLSSQTDSSTEQYFRIFL